jgi:hypothetical protein
MSRKHLFSIVVLLGAATVAGVLALTSTRQLGALTTQASSAQIAARSRSLDRLEASLQRSLAKQPPAVPAVSRPAPQRTIFVRPTAGSAQTASHEDEHQEEDEGWDD